MVVIGMTTVLIGGPALLWFIASHLLIGWH
jgi:hypothetical protein